MVVVLIPPPVDAGDAPINIKIIIKNKVLSLNKVKSIVLYPAVLSVTDWNIEDKTFSFILRLPKVPLLLNSFINIKNIPMAISIPVVLITILECIFSFEYFLLFITSSKTGNPIPPNIINPQITKFINELSTKDVNEENLPAIGPIKSNPALQNAEIEWNILYQTPLKNPNTGIYTIESNKAPIASIENVIKIMYLVSFTRPDKSP